MFYENELIAIKMFIKIKVSQKIYLYADIQKILVGRFYDKLDPGKNIYSLFIDNDDQIIKFYTIRTYKECHEIMKLIIEKTGKKIYDDTDISYLSEDDFIRNYYKLNKIMADVKNE
jgi:regulator of sigma D